MAKAAASAIPSISLSIPLNTSAYPMNATVSVFQKGTDAFDLYPIESEVELKGSNDVVLKGIVKAVNVGALIDLISSYGSQSMLTYGQGYSARNLIQSLSTDGSVVDVTKLYSAVMIMLPPVAYTTLPIPTP